MQYDMRKFIHLFSILLAAGLMAAVNTGCTAKAKKVYHLQKANRYFDAGQYDQAEIEYMNVLRNDHENFQAISRLADIYYDEGRLLRAAPFIVAGHHLATNDLDLNIKMGILYLSAGKIKEARDEANFVLDRKPQDDQAPMLLEETAVTPAAAEEIKQRLQMLSQKSDSASLQVALGSIALRAGDLKSAESAFKRAQTLNPKSSAAWSALGTLYLVQTNLAPAESAFKTAADLAPARSHEKLEYAGFKAETGDPATAKRMLEEMVKKTPDYIPAWMELAKLAAAEKKYDDALAFLDKLLARDPDNFDALLSSAQVKLTQGKTAEATTDLERLTKIYPQAFRAHYQLAIAYLAGNDADKAAASLKKSMALDANFSEAILLLAELEIKTGSIDPAIVSLKQLIHQHPQIVQAQLLLADAYRARGNFEDSLAIYRQLQISYPKSFQIPLAMGVIFLQQKDNGEANKAFTRALELAPDNITALEQLVNLDLTEKHYAEALRQVQPQLEKNPKLAAPHILQAQIFMAQGDTNQAEAALLKAVELQPEIETGHMLLAHLYMDSKQNKKALAELQIAATKNTNDVTPFLMTGMIQSDDKDYKAARDAYEKLLVMDPKYSPALNNLAYLYSEYLDDLDRAYELAQRARDLLPNDPSTADTLGWVLCKRGQYPSALSLLQQAATQLPDEPEVQFHLGKAYYMMGQEDSARLAFQHALQSGRDFRGKDECNQCLAVLAVDPKTAGADVRANLEKRVATQPDDSIAVIRLAAIYQRDGAVDKAEGAYEAALKINPKNVQALINLSQLYYANKNSQKALELAKAAYNLAPDNADIALILGRLAYVTGDYKLSLNLLQQIGGNQSGNPQVLFDFAKAAYAMGQVADAQTAMRNALQTGGDFAGANEARRFVNLTALADNPSQTASSAAQVEAILKSEPDYVPALMIMARINEQNNAGTAKQTYEKVLNRHPDFSPAQRRMAILCAENADNDPQAYEFATKARAAFPDDPEVAKTLGIILYLRGDYMRAERLLKESAAVVNSDPENLYYLGMAQYQLKKSAECKKNLQQAIKLNLPAKFVPEAKQVLAELK
jgi:tetratricopeptide (TPR) repeat protein